MTREELDAIKARCNNAIPGPWKYGEDFCTTKEMLVLGIVYPGRDYPEHPFYETCNIDFIVNSRQDVPALIAEVERLQNKRDRDAAKHEQLSIMLQSIIRDLERLEKYYAGSLTSATM